MTDPRTYTDADAALHHRGTGARMHSRIVARNTRLVRRGSTDIAVQLHATDVVTHHTGGSFTVDSGGYRTVTTKDRINRFTPIGFYVYSRAGKWFARIGDAGESSDFDHGRHVEYFDGMTVDADAGTVTNPEDAPNFDTIDAENAATERLIADYVKGIDATTAGEILASAPAGDCFYCLLRDTGSGKPLGDEIGNTDHLRSHLAERYYMQSLIRNAYADRYPHPALVAGVDLQALATGKRGGGDIRREVRRYLRRRLIADREIT
jgi:hypothetical protein